MESDDSEGAPLAPDSVVERARRNEHLLGSEMRDLGNSHPAELAAYLERQRKATAANVISIAQRKGDDHLLAVRKYPTFTRAFRLLGESPEDVDYVVDGMLPHDGTAILAGRPKGGKSTLALNLALNVARGEAFLGRKTSKGPVLYLALEGSKSGWMRLLRGLGVVDEDELFICIDRAPEGALQWLQEQMEAHRPALVVIDIMQRLLRVKDGNDYATGSNATDAVIELARHAKAAVLMLHHSGKTRRGDIVDEVMGSTAYAAAVDSVLLLRKTERFRTLASEQRVGENLSETVLEMDPETFRVRPVGTKIESDRAEMRIAIEDFLSDRAELQPDEPTCDEATILQGIEGGRTKSKREALRDLYAAGRIERIGAGKRGDPYRYSVSRSLVPDHSGEQENDSPETEENPPKLDFVSRSHGRTALNGIADEKPPSKHRLGFGETPA